MPQLQVGKLYIPKGAIPKQHEISLAELLIRTGHKVCFVEVGPRKTPDIYFLHKYWEIKSPAKRIVTGQPSTKNPQNYVKKYLFYGNHYVIIQMYGRCSIIELWSRGLFYYVCKQKSVVYFTTLF